MTKKQRFCLVLPVLCLALILGLGAVADGFLDCERALAERQASVLQELREGAGEYSEHTLVLENTTPARAAVLAERLCAKLRTASDGTYAALTLPQGKSVTQVLAARENRDILSELSLDTLCELSDTAAAAGTTPTPQWPYYWGNDSYYDEQTNLKYVGLGDTWRTTRGEFSDGRKVKVALVDSGIDVDHPDFYDMYGEFIVSEQSYNATTDTTVLAGGWNVIDDTYGHGTNVAGVIAAQMNRVGVVGIAPDVELLVIKAEADSQGKYSHSDLVFGIDYAIERGVDVISMSIGRTSPYEERLMKKVAAHNVILVCAAGNSGDDEKLYPAADPRVIGVGALAHNSWGLASYSSYGESSDLVAPGTVCTTAVGGGYTYADGTSFACPTVSAAVALYISKYGVTPYDELRARLLGTCVDLGASGEDLYYGHGALNISRFLDPDVVKITFDYRMAPFEQEHLFVSKAERLSQVPSFSGTQGGLRFEGWYRDARLTQKINAQTQTFSEDTVLYARWQGASSGDFDYYEYKTGHVRILAYRGSSDVMEIPDTLGGKRVSSIAPLAFWQDAALKEVLLPGGLETVGVDAFEGCVGLNVVRIRSAALLRDITESSSPGNVCQYADAILVDQALDFNWSTIVSSYPYTDTVQWGDTSYTKYSNHESVWTHSDVLVAHIPCQQDGIVKMTCDRCGCADALRLPMHDESDWTLTKNVTKTEAGEEQRTCLTCDRTLEERVIAPFTHLLEFEQDVAALTGECTRVSFEDIAACIRYYNTLGEQERLVAGSDYEQLLRIIERYNENATARNAELSGGEEPASQLLAQMSRVLDAIGYSLEQKAKKRGITV